MGMKNKNEIHNFWKNPNDRNLPEKYLDGKKRTDFLVDEICKIAADEDSVLEIGCNVGRNLNGLFDAGFDNLYGIEINKEAVGIMSNEFPIMYHMSTIHNDTVEEILPELKTDSIDIIYTMAVLEHIHPDSEQLVFGNMIRVAKKYILVIEDERKVSERHCPRNYSDIFNCDKFWEIKTVNKLKIGLSNKYVYRLFKVK